MVRTVKNDIVEQYDTQMSSSFWSRNKKDSVNLNESAFATDRQLEDQKFLREKCRNPHGMDLLKSDKVKSEKGGQTKEINALVTKAKVLNKIVREASGVFNYALVPPIIDKQQKKPEKSDSKIDPDTCTYVAPYRKESGSNPIIMSFGHRPRSASRTFYPGTMKVMTLKDIKMHIIYKLIYFNQSNL